MGLSSARHPTTGAPLVRGPGPYDTRALAPLQGLGFRMEADTPWLMDTGDAEHAYLDAARQAWEDEPLYMDYLDETSPVLDLKTTQHALYLHQWEPWLDEAETVLDVGCGIGRFTLPLLDEGHTVHGVDGDLRSLQRCAWRAVGRPGKLDLHWSDVRCLPEVSVDAAIAAEVLCYVPDTEAALRHALSRVRPGGAFLLAMEARWGWALAPDAPEGALGQALVGDGELDLPGDRYVRTYDKDDLVALCRRVGLAIEEITPTHYVLDGPLENVAGGVPPFDALLDIEEACRSHPVWAPLNRIWMVAGVRA